MTKAYPQIQVKEPDDETDMGFKGGPVKAQSKSWRELSGKRRTFGAPTGGWPEFDKEGNVVKRRTDPGQPEGVTPKGYLYTCWQCSSDAGLEDEYNLILSALVVGDCDVCGTKQVGRMGLEEARYRVLLKEQQSKAASGEAADG